MTKSRRRRPDGERRPRPAISSFIEKAKELGAKEAKLIKASTIVTAPWVRMKCQYGCSGFGSSLCCPPYTPTPEEMQEVVDSYEKAILFEAGRGGARKIAAELERHVFLSGYYKAFGLGSGPCRLCDEECTFEEGCRHSREARPSMEACGIDVFETVRSNGFEIEVVRDHEDMRHFFGCVLVE